MNCLFYFTLSDIGDVLRRIIHLSIVCIFLFQYFQLVATWEVLIHQLVYRIFRGREWCNIQFNTLVPCSLYVFKELRRGMDVISSVNAFHEALLALLTAFWRAILLSKQVCHALPFLFLKQFPCLSWGSAQELNVYGNEWRIHSSSRSFDSLFPWFYGQAADRALVYISQVSTPLCLAIVQ